MKKNSKNMKIVKGTAKHMIHNNIHIIGIPEGKETGKVPEIIYI